MHQSLALPADITRDLDGQVDGAIRQHRARRGAAIRLALADMAGVVAASLVTSFLDGPVVRTTDTGLLDSFKAALLAFAFWLLVAGFRGLYGTAERPDHTFVDDLGPVLTTATLAVWFSLATNWILVGNETNRVGLVLFWALLVALVTVARTLARADMGSRIDFAENALIVGAGDVGQTVAEKLLPLGGWRLNIVGFVDGDPKPLRPGLRHLAVLGPVTRLQTLVDLFEIDRVIIAFTGDNHAQMVPAVRALKGCDVQVDIVPRLFETFGTRGSVHTVNGFPLVALPPLQLSRAAVAAKRTMDLVGSLAALIVLAPLLAGIALLIRIDSRGPTLYRHDRVGRGGKPIRVLKFRTMHLEFCRGTAYGGESAEEAFARLMADPERAAEFERSHKFSDDPRVTRIGKVLRRTSLDELPQLVNVLKGDISLVGPRPVTREELARYGIGADALLNARPGLTGYWQICGRSDTSYAERVRLDLAYVTSWSLGSDLMILGKTFGKALIAKQGAL